LDTFRRTGTTCRSLCTATCSVWRFMMLVRPAMDQPMVSAWSQPCSTQLNGESCLLQPLLFMLFIAQQSEHTPVLM
jgi:hypothetical protein